MFTNFCCWMWCTVLNDREAVMTWYSYLIWTRHPIRFYMSLCFSSSILWTNANWQFEPSDNDAFQLIDSAGILQSKTFWMTGSIVRLLCVRITTFWKLPCDSDLTVILTGPIEAFSPTLRISRSIFLALFIRSFWPCLQLLPKPGGNVVFMIVSGSDCHPKSHNLFFFSESRAVVASFEHFCINFGPFCILPHQPPGLDTNYVFCLRWAVTVSILSPDIAWSHYGWFTWIQKRCLLIFLDLRLGRYGVRTWCVFFVV